MAKAYLVLSSWLKRSTALRVTSLGCGCGTLPFNMATAKSLSHRCQAAIIASVRGPSATVSPVILTTGVVEGSSDICTFPFYVISLSRVVFFRTILSDNAKLLEQE